MDNSVVLDYSPRGRNGLVTITARLGDDVLAIDCCDVTKSKDRAAFASALCKDRPGIDQTAVEAELLRLAADLATQHANAPAEAEALIELDVSSIVRPERFITPEVSGLTVPTMMTAAGRPVGRWLLFLRWADGRRERRTLPECLDLPDGRRLWIHPPPPDPAPSTLAGWSSESRQAWLDGARAPDPATVFQHVCERLAYYLDLPRDRAPGIVATLALWVMMTYNYTAWDAVPYLFIGGPPGSGKTRTFEVLAKLVFRPLVSSSMTGPALFRTIHAQGGTLLLDEAERLRRSEDPATAELLAMLLAGYKRGGQATRLEPVGDTFRTVSYDVYGPKALACIAGLPPALASRAVPLTMFRADQHSEKPRRRVDADPAWQRIRDELHALALEHGPTWLDLPRRSDVCPPMSGRNYELWQPLLALAAWIEDHGSTGLLGLMQRHALETIEAANDDQVADTDELLLRLLAERRAILETPTPGDLLKAAQEAEPAVFRGWSAKGVANALKRYGIHTATMRGRKVYSKVSTDELRRIQATYGMVLFVEDNAGTA